MAISQYLTSSFLLVLALWADFGHSSGLHLADVNGKQLLQRSNSSFYGGVALWVTTTESTDVCPSDLQSCQQGVDGTCCPQGTYCEDDGYYCCPIDIDCSEVVKAAPVCADPSWGLYEADGNGDILFCCLPDAYGLPGSGCVASSASGTPSQVASSLTQAHVAATVTSPATSGTEGATATQGITTGNATVTGTTQGVTTGAGTGTTTTQASSTSTKSSANKLFSGGLLTVIVFVLISGLAA